MWNSSNGKSCGMMAARAVVRSLSKCDGVPVVVSFSKSWHHHSPKRQ